MKQPFPKALRSDPNGSPPAQSYATTTDRVETSTSPYPALCTIDSAPYVPLCVGSWRVDCLNVVSVKVGGCGV
jgi:hypothetical protein